ncbi:MAG: hypothetical protein ACK53Y_03075, partial [bacterium]
MDEVRVVSRAKSSAADLEISPAFRLSSVRLKSPPARSLATGRPQQLQLPASDPHHQPGTSSWPCSSRAWTFEAGRNSGSLALV